MLVGFGVVGQSFVKILLSKSAELYSTFGLNPRVVACVDSDGMAVSPGGLDLGRLLEAKRTKNLCLHTMTRGIISTPLI